MIIVNNIKVHLFIINNLILEEEEGIEPSSIDSKSIALPLCYSSKMASMKGLEPSFSGRQPELFPNEYMPINLVGLLGLEPNSEG